MLDLKKLAEFMSTKENFAWVNSSATEEIKRQRIEELKNKFLSGNFSNFSAVEDVGNEEFSFMNDSEFNFSDYNTAAKAHFGISTITNIVARRNVRDSIRQYVLQRNEIVKRNKAKKLEQDKQKKNKFVSHPNWY